MTERPHRTPAMNETHEQRRAQELAWMMETKLPQNVRTAASCLSELVSLLLTEKDEKAKHAWDILDEAFERVQEAAAKLGVDLTPDL
jgi:macrodomain Ter protein organizer (MatP/YcbG family)